MFNIILLIGAFLAVGIFVLAFLLPNETMTQRRKKERTAEAINPEDKKWQDTAYKMEKHINALHMDIEKFKATERRLQKELALEKSRATKLQGRVLQEKQWLSKDEESLEKKDHDIHDLKNALLKAQNDVELEHAASLRFEQQLKELKADFEVLKKETFDANVKAQRLEVETAAFKKDMFRYRKEYEDLKRKNEETDWVAKPEYERVVKDLREKAKELERVSREDKDA